MNLYPLIFSTKELVYGNGFLAEVEIRGRALGVDEGDGDWWFNGVEPGGLAEGGQSLNEAYHAFRDTLKEILVDIAYEVADFEAFERRVERFGQDVNRTNDADWWKCVEAVRKGELHAPAKDMREEKAEDEAQVTITAVDPAKNLLDPSRNELGELAAAA